MQGIGNRLLMGGAFICMLTGFSYCSSTQVEEEVVELALLPISPDWDKKLKGTGSELSEFGCMVSTLGNSRSEYTYNYQGFELLVPESMLAEAHGESKVYSFRVLHPDAAGTSPEEIVPGDYVRIVNCRIPDHPDVLDLIHSRLPRFDETSWALVEGDQQAKAKTASTGFYVQECTIETITYTFPNTGTVIIESYLICTVHLMEFPDPFGGGGGIGGGDDPDPPCGPFDICVDNPGGPSQHTDNECDLPNPPKYCEDCPPGELGIMNEIDIKIAKAAVADSSNFNAPNQSDRREIPFLHEAQRDGANQITGYKTIFFPEGVFEYKPEDCELTIKSQVGLRTFMLKQRGKELIWGHTHPWSLGEIQECRDRPDYDGNEGAGDSDFYKTLDVYLMYRGDPSVDTYTGPLKPLSGAYVVDKDGTKEFDGTSTPNDPGDDKQRLTKCGRD